MSDEHEGHDSSEMRDLVRKMLATEHENHRMITLQISCIAAPHFRDILKLGLKMFSAGGQDANSMRAVDETFRAMDEAASGMTPEEARANGVNQDAIEFMRLSPKERDEARRAHKAMTLLGIAEIALLPDEAGSEMTRIMAEHGTTTCMSLPRQVVDNIDTYCEHAFPEEDDEQVRVMLMGPPKLVAEFAREHNLGDEWYDQNEHGFPDDDNEEDV